MGQRSRTETTSTSTSQARPTTTTDRAMFIHQLAAVPAAIGIGCTLPRGNLCDQLATAAQERIRIGEKRPQHSRDGQGTFVAPGRHIRGAKFETCSEKNCRSGRTRSGATA